MSDRRLPAADVRSVLRGTLDIERSAQSLADWLVPGLVDGRSGLRVVDLGCGRGESLDLFRASDPAVRWTGVEVEGSEELAARSRGDGEIVLFDGVSLPFEDASVDVVFCKQVLEHVERPEPLVADVARVLRPGGAFAGSTSQLEPYHGWATQNPTPYGLRRLLERSGLELERVWPSIDGFSLLVRRLARNPARMDAWWARASPFNRVVDGAGRLLGWDAEDRNAVKLLFCGQYVFVGRRA